MALIKCKECGKEFSSSSKACPNCGYKKKGLLYYFACIFCVYCILMVFVILFLQLKGESRTSTNKIAIKQSQQDNTKLKLLSGYQNIKFGMNKQQVNQLFDGKLVQSKEKYSKYIKDKAEIIFWFFNDALYEVEVRPNAKTQRMGHGAATEDMQNTIGAMVAKYGPYQKIPNMVEVIEGSFQQPLEYYKWTFNDKEIILSYWDMGGWFNEKTRNFGSAEHETLTIRYRDLSIKRQKEQEEAKQATQKKQRAIQQKQQELDSII